jgi:tetratricopeptide (TPR) repeat protein
LERLAYEHEEYPDDAAEAYRFVGLAYQFVGGHHNAEAPYRKATELETDERRRADSYNYLAYVIHRQERAEEAHRILDQGLANMIDRSAKAALYKSHALLYEQEKNLEAQILALEMALHLTPEDTITRFSAARAYDVFDLKLLTLLNYEIILNTSPDDAAALNNLAVEYQRFDLSILAVDNYLRSYKLGETLAGANLGFQYITAGFTDDAKNLLEEAALQPTPHQSVARALASITETTERQNEQLKTLEERARRLRAFMGDYARAFFSSSTDPAPFTGHWQTHGDYVAVIEQTGNSIKSTWSLDGQAYKLVGGTNGMSMRIEKITASFETGSGYTFDKLGKAFGILAEDRQIIRLAVPKKDDVEYHVWRRLPPDDADQ